MATTAPIIERPSWQGDSPKEVKLNDLEKRLLNEYQKGLPLTPTPYADIATHLGTSEALVLQILSRLQEMGVISRIGPVFKPKRVGVSTLVAMAVPEEQLELVAEQINNYAEVNHNYEREDRYNLWFVVTAGDKTRLQAVLTEMKHRTGYPLLNLPLEKQFHIDLGFPLWC
ncbi:MAG: Lrp/AsnC family transcriptional regulator [Sedimenticola sp.]